MREFTEQELVRREKAEKIREMGMDPYGNKFDRTAYNFEIKEKYQDVAHEEFENIDDEYTVAGRIMFIRKMGKASFFTIQDKTGKMQKITCSAITYKVKTCKKSCISRRIYTKAVNTEQYVWE